MSSIEDIPSAVNADEIEFLVRHARNAKHGIIEIGSSFGKSSVALGQVAKEKGLPMMCVDTWPEKDDFPTWRKNIEEAGLTDTVMPIHTSSLAAARFFRHNYPSRQDYMSDTSGGWDGLSHYSGEAGFDFLFIDADHSHEAVVSDFVAWTYLLKRPAMIVFHDIAVPSFGVDKLWGELTAVYGHESFYNIGAIFLP